MNVADNTRALRTMFALSAGMANRQQQRQQWRALPLLQQREKKEKRKANRSGPADEKAKQKDLLPPPSRPSEKEQVLGTRDRVSDDERPSGRAAQFVRGPEYAPTEGLQTEV